MSEDVSTVTRELLYEQVWSKPMTKLAKEYGVSDVALAKVCRKLNVPLPVRGYWNKLQHGKKVPPRPPLLPLQGDQSRPVRITRSPPARPPENSHPAVDACARSLASGGLRVEMPDSLQKLHPAVWPRAARKAAARDGVEPQDVKTLPVNVGKEVIGRALGILDALAKALEAHGYPVTAEGATIEGQLVPIAIMEQQDKVLHVPTARELASKKANSWEKIPTWDHVPSGRLSIHSDVYVWWRRDLRKRWSDGRRSVLEETLDDVLLGLVALGAAKRQRADEERTEAERRAEQERQRLERERQVRISDARNRNILGGAEALEKARAVRDLISAVEHRAATGKAEPTPELQEWLERARSVASELDPLAGGLVQMLRAYDEAAEAAGKPPVTNRWGG